MAARSGVQKISLLRRGWHEAPDLVLSLAMSVAGVAVFCAGGVYLHNMGDRRNMYKTEYTVIRDTDVKDPKKLGDIYN